MCLEEKGWIVEGLCESLKCHRENAVLACGEAESRAVLGAQEFQTPCLAYQKRPASSFFRLLICKKQQRLADLRSSTEIREHWHIVCYDDTANLGTRI